MPGHSGTTTVGRITIDGVASAFAVENAAVLFQMANELAAFHYTATSTERVSQMAPLGAPLTALSR